MNLIGKSLKNRYYIISFLGEGGMAQVYVANDVIAKREESIKKVKSYIYDGTFKEHSDEIKEETGYRFKDYYDYKAAYVKRNGNSKNLFEGDTNFSQKIREEDYHELDESKNRELFLQVAEFSP